MSEEQDQIEAEAEMPTATKIEQEEAKPEAAPELTHDQLAERTEKRRKFKEIYLKLVELNPNDACDLLQEIMANIQSAILLEAQTRKFNELEVKPATLNDGVYEELSKQLLDIVKDSTLHEGTTWLSNHANRINLEARMKLNDMRVGELGIEKLLLE